MRNQPVHVVRIDKTGQRRKMIVSANTWERLREKPTLSGRYRWEIAPVGSIAKPVPDEKLDIYGDDDYKADNKKGKELMDTDPDEALRLLTRAYDYKQVPYYKGLINKLQNG